MIHGAEITVPGRLPVASQVLGRVLRGAELVVSAGGYPLAEAVRAAGRTLPHAWCRPGWTPIASGPWTRPNAAPPAPTWACRRTGR